MSSTTTDTSASASATSLDATPKSDSRILAVVIILSVLGFLIISGVMYFTYRQSRRRRRAGSIAAGPYHGFVVDKDHPAAHVTPFGAPGGEGPRFLHTPGSDMRLALRRPDGAWHFSSPRSPFTPTGISEPSPLPSPSISSPYLPLGSPRPSLSVKSNKELEVEREREKKKKEEREGYAYGYEDIEGFPNPPPPAYGVYAYEGDGDPFASRESVCISVRSVVGTDPFLSRR
ncbi:hypothetical protein BDQ17DRAFT_1344528 [Cyathus striatus]|nr:hypothetical protein BDQ17DRAFT_1344528 [Cyathus striatus]